MNNSRLIERQFNNYKMIDIFKYIAAIMVICLHCNQVFAHEQIDFFIKNIVCRTAVPFFFVCSAYFVRKRSYSVENYINRYLKKLTKSYLLWSLIFIPIGLDWIYQNLNIAGNLLPIALILGLVHVGTYYHLWYIPAMIFSIFIVNILVKRISYKTIFLISIVLYLFGSIETYYGLLSLGAFKDFFDTLIKVIFTTRSGLFYGLIFVTIGFYIFDNQERLKIYLRYVPVLTLLSAVLLLGEGVFLYKIPKLDMNFLVMLIPFVFFFFIWVLSLSYQPQGDTKKVRELSKYYYFVHTVCIIIVEEIGKAFHINMLSFGFVSLLFVILLTHILSITIIKIQNQPLTYSDVLLSVIYGMILTFILASFFYQLKPLDSLIKFEWVPCIWFFSSFMIYSLLLKKA